MQVPVKMANTISNNNPIHGLESDYSSKEHEITETHMIFEAAWHRPIMTRAYCHYYNNFCSNACTLTSFKSLIKLHFILSSPSHGSSKFSGYPLK